MERESPGALEIRYSVQVPDITRHECSPTRRLDEAIRAAKTTWYRALPSEVLTDSAPSVAETAHGTGGATGLL